MITFSLSGALRCLHGSLAAQLGRVAAQRAIVPHPVAGAIACGHAPAGGKRTIPLPSLRDPLNAVRTRRRHGYAWLAAVERRARFAIARSQNAFNDSSARFAAATAARLMSAFTRNTTCFLIGLLMALSLLVTVTGCRCDGR